eukprot:56610-Eustigmatos_ZCMA.PRE.1
MLRLDTDFVVFLRAPSLYLCPSVSFVISSELHLTQPFMIASFQEQICRSLAIPPCNRSSIHRRFVSTLVP